MLPGSLKGSAPAVAPFKPGDAVFGMAKGSFAEYACAAASQLAVSPRQETFRLATDRMALTHGGIDRVARLARHHGQLRQPTTVLINGRAAGGVGTFAVQIAKSLWRAASPRDVQHQKCPSCYPVDREADGVIDYTGEDFAPFQPSTTICSSNLVGQIFSLADCLSRSQAAEGTYIACGEGPRPELHGLCSRNAPQRGLVDIVEPEDARAWLCKNQSRKDLAISPTLPPTEGI